MQNNTFENSYFGEPYKADNGKKVFFLHRLDDGSVSCLVGNEKSYGFSILEPEEILSKWDNWVSVTDRLPETGKFVLIKLKNSTVYHNKITVGYYDNCWKFENDCFAENVTHWMELPAE